MNFEDKQIDQLIKLALSEDVGSGDVTTEALIPKKLNTEAFIVAKEEGVIAGLGIVEKVFQSINKKIKVKNKVKDGDKVSNGDIIMTLKGPHGALLTGERTALNFLQRMSGIATKTNLFVKEIKKYNTVLLDTRKTAAGHRLLDKYAVEVGGGKNHRFGLYDMVMIKDNHIKVAGSIKKAVKQVRKNLKQNLKIEVETTNLSEVEEALSCKVDVIMLDNMSLKEMKIAMDAINGKVKAEASGNMDLDKLKWAASIGVDFISVGELTHSVKALDLSMRFK
ncbi:MAG: carboxylating nicotinate-nucleotide diphosphorylase [Melioribacteraceae bacterium]|nr:carboxylating nicotinate-nucleotide diphosphorylase [Melioribacteraceae bacterium]MCF8263058.1 carboxylating nicotinate-nucleotide diphosphorylase [Melioribacteraceae bacterium]MCF8413849.1 carboxylating nicotinate-nucleotide diphosphorylase [Melioribacteraceae bacterium]MCF8431250.1 carboxylating nicotinate-nucleotide diphosphorylase [Melioribacteraceae bacterium]